MTRFLWMVFVLSALNSLYLFYLCLGVVSGLRARIIFKIVPYLLAIGTALCIVAVFLLHWLTGIPLPVK